MLVTGLEGLVTGIEKARQSERLDDINRRAEGRFGIEQAQEGRAVEKFGWEQEGQARTNKAREAVQAAGEASRREDGSVDPDLFLKNIPTYLTKYGVADPETVKGLQEHIETMAGKKLDRQLTGSQLRTEGLRQDKYGLEINELQTEAGRKRVNETVDRAYKLAIAGDPVGAANAMNKVYPDLNLTSVVPGANGSITWTAEDGTTGTYTREEVDVLRGKIPQVTKKADKDDGWKTEVDELGNITQTHKDGRVRFIDRQTGAVEEVDPNKTQMTYDDAVTAASAYLRQGETPERIIAAFSQRMPQAEAEAAVAAAGGLAANQPAPPQPVGSPAALPVAPTALPIPKEAPAVEAPPAEALAPPVTGLAQYTGLNQPTEEYLQRLSVSQLEELVAGIPKNAKTLAFFPPKRTIFDPALRRTRRRTDEEYRQVLTEYLMEVGTAAALPKPSAR